MTGESNALTGDELKRELEPVVAPAKEVWSGVKGWHPPKQELSGG